jgi:hypothetical protein
VKVISSPGVEGLLALFTIRRFFGCGFHIEDDGVVYVDAKKEGG